MREGYRSFVCTHVHINTRQKQRGKWLKNGVSVCEDVEDGRDSVQGQRRKTRSNRVYVK